jgi:hypothetical protein
MYDTTELEQRHHEVPLSPLLMIELFLETVDRSFSFDERAIIQSFGTIVLSVQFDLILRTEVYLTRFAIREAVAFAMWGVWVFWIVNNVYIGAQLQGECDFLEVRKAQGVWSFSGVYGTQDIGSDSKLANLPFVRKINHEICCLQESEVVELSIWRIFLRLSEAKVLGIWVEVDRIAGVLRSKDFLVDLINVRWSLENTSKVRGSARRKAAEP